MKTRRFSRRCMCYYCTGSVLEYRKKTSQEKYKDSLLEYELQLIISVQDDYERIQKLEPQSLG